MELSPGCREYGFSGDVAEVDVLRRLPRREFAQRCRWRGDDGDAGERPVRDATLAMILHDKAQETHHGYRRR